MNTFGFSLILGIILAIIDILPMIVKKLPRYSILASFFHFTIATVVIINININFLPWWLSGGVLGLLLIVPILIHVAHQDKKPLAIIAFNAVFLGSIAKIAAHFLL